MKRITILSTAAIFLLLTAFVVVQAESRGGHRWCGHHFGPAGYLVHELKLSDAQKAQIQTLWQAERPVLAVHIHDLLAENKEMSTIAATSIPDQSEVQKIANREANTIAAMLMEKARLQSKIYSTVLNSDQRAKADELQNKWESRLNRLAGHLESQPIQK
ncbi:MAG: periplasmic heavy metal sensor [Terracidiphilus sp.]